MINIAILVDRTSLFKPNPTKIAREFGFNKDKCRVLIMAFNGSLTALRVHVMINTIIPNPEDSSLLADAKENWIATTKMRLSPYGIYIDLKDYNARLQVSNPSS